MPLIGNPERGIRAILAASGMPLNLEIKVVIAEWHEMLLASAVASLRPSWFANALLLVLHGVARRQVIVTRFNNSDIAPLPSTAWNGIRAPQRTLGDKTPIETSR